MSSLDFLITFLRSKGIIGTADDLASLGETRLLSSGLLKSIQVMELMLEIERAIGTSIKAEDLTTENFDTVASIRALVTRYRT